MSVLTALSLLATIYIALGVLLAYRGNLGFMVELHVAAVKDNPDIVKYKLILYACALRLGAVLGWPLFIWRG